MSETKQVIVMRKDLGMRKGKMIAQGAHASMKVLLDQTIKHSNFFVSWDPTVTWSLTVFHGSPMWEWLSGKFTKIVLGCESEEELLDLYNKAKENKICCSLITDAGLTEFHGVPTNTCIGIGPDDVEKIDVITGHLRLL